MTHPFNPDWTVAPSGTLQDILDENGLDLKELVNATAGTYTEADALTLVKEVLAAKPLTENHAICLALCTGISVKFWMAREANYRRDLANGLKDTTWT